MGGDIKDIDRLQEKFSSMLGNSYGCMDGADDRGFHSQQRVLNSIVSNVDFAAKPSGSPNGFSEVDIWQLSLKER